MAASFKQMSNRRKAHNITRRMIQGKLGCSESWVRWLEAGFVTTGCRDEWHEKYAEALEEAIKERS